MKPHPILFTTLMVQAILDGRKTMTRRIVKMPKEGITDASWGFTAFTPTGSISFRGKHADGRYGESFVKCPYGKIGNILWVKEVHYRFGRWNKNGQTKTGRQRWRFRIEKKFPNVLFMDNPPAVIEKNIHRSLGWYKRSPLFMPMEVCRLRLEITAIRVEKLLDVSEEDSIKEGVQTNVCDHETAKYCPSSLCKNGCCGEGEWYNYHGIDLEPTYSAIESFETLWAFINGQESWDINPWVWVIEFKKIEKL